MEVRLRFLGIQAVFALLLGNGLGIVTRALRQNAGYYFGLFPAGLAQSMLFWNVGTVALLTGLSLDVQPLRGGDERAEIAAAPVLGGGEEEMDVQAQCSEYLA